MRTEPALLFYSCHMAPCCRKLSHMEAIQTRVVVLNSFLFFLFLRQSLFLVLYFYTAGSRRSKNMRFPTADQCEHSGRRPSDRTSLCRFETAPEFKGEAPLRLDAVLQHADVALPLVQRHHVHQAPVCTHHSGVDGRLADAGTLRHKRDDVLKLRAFFSPTVSTSSYQRSHHSSHTHILARCSSGELENLRVPDVAQHRRVDARMAVGRERLVRG